VIDASAPPSGGVALADPPRAVRGLLEALLEGLRTRLDVAAVGLEIHLQRLLRLLIRAVGAIAGAMLALAFGVAALVAALRNTHRVLRWSAAAWYT
jgi:uncharacterized membrane protein YqjE